MKTNPCSKSNPTHYMCGKSNWEWENTLRHLINSRKGHCGASIHQPTCLVLLQLLFFFAILDRALGRDAFLWSWRWRAAPLTLSHAPRPPMGAASIDLLVSLSLWSIRHNKESIVEGVHKGLDLECVNMNTHKCLSTVRFMPYLWRSTATLH